MRILVLSDSHAGLSFMRQCMRSVRPNCVIHLGDFYEDGKALSEENPGTPFYQVPGNCDRYRCPEGLHESMCLTFDGVWIFMTHGHRQKVKSALVNCWHRQECRGLRRSYTAIPTVPTAGAKRGFGS